LITNDNREAAEKTCIKCGNAIASNKQFCGACGSRQLHSADAVVENKWSRIKQAGLFYGLFIVLCASSNFIDDFQTVRWSLFFEVALATTSVGFFTFNWTENNKLLTWPDFSFQKLCAYCALAVAASVFVHYSVGWLNFTMYSRQQENFTFLKGNILGEFLLIFFTAATPALFEELGFRGYLLQNLLKVADVAQALFVTSFLFAIIHMSFVSLFWLIPFAWLLGAVRLKENTLWYGVFMHFCFNLTACLFMLSGL